MPHRDPEEAERTVSSNPLILHGKTVFAGTRIPLSRLLHR